MSKVMRPIYRRPMRRIYRRRAYPAPKSDAYYSTRRLARQDAYVNASRIRAEKRQEAKDRALATKEPGVISAAGGALGGIAGTLLGPVGSAAGSFIGGKLGHLIEKITGFGDYKVEANTILKGGMQVPQIVNSIAKGGVIIRHREYLADVSSSVDFAIQKFNIQPGLPDCFPWLSQVANSFEQYKLRGMLFEFNSLSSASVLSTATSSSLGSVMMMTEYDVADTGPTTKRQMLNAEYSCSAKPSETFVHPIECKRSQTPINMLYTRSSAVPAGFDQRLYDFANFYIATEGMQGVDGHIGELWVTYEIELYKPQFNYTALCDHFRLAGITNLLPLGTTSALVNIVSSQTGSTLGGTVSSTEYIFPPTVSSGNYIWVYNCVGGGAINVASPVVSYVNCVEFAILIGDTLNQIWVPSPSVGVNQTSITNYGIVTVTGQGAKLTFSTTGTFPTAPIGDLFVSRLPDTIEKVSP